MDAIELLKQQHQEVKDLFEQIEEADEPEEKAELLQDLADNFAAHGTIEERIFYPAAYAESTRELLEEAVEEHLSAKRVLADLLAMKPGDENFDAKVKVLKEQVEHHVEEEEGELFPKVRTQFDADYLESMGDKMEELFDQLMSDSPSENIPAETKKAAPIKPKRDRAGA
jgi:iron-sulfur cluster repair protein YtfE (RIC family)